MELSDSFQQSEIVKESTTSEFIGIEYSDIAFLELKTKLVNTDMKLVKTVRASRK